MTLPIHPHLLVLRSAVTVLLSLLIGQAGWASAAIGRDKHWFRFHELFAVPTVLAAIATAVCFVVLRRTAGRGLTIVAVLAAVLSIVQAVLGFVEIADVHMFHGILLLMLVTGLTSWTYRLPTPNA